jgi:excisionase family DNA binding protein
MEKAKTVTQGSEERRLITLAAFAATLSLSIHTARKWVQDGKITTNKLGGRRLVPVTEVDRLMRETCIPARAKTA